jgi:hypothetical protein
MLTGLPSLEVVLLTFWKLTIVIAAIVFVWLLARKVWRTMRRSIRTIIRFLGSGRKVKRQAFQPSPAFISTAEMSEEGLSKI